MIIGKSTGVFNVTDRPHAIGVIFGAKICLFNFTKNCILRPLFKHFKI